MFLDPPADIIVTASLAPTPAATSSASTSVLSPETIDRLGTPLVADLLRSVPSVAVSVSGPAGSLTDVRIRGAEANHTLLFLDGIALNDPAAGNTPRFELLNADLADRIEVVRGPQSALWGSEAIGGVVAVQGETGVHAPGASAEAGSFGERRAAASAEIGNDRHALNLAIAAQRADGIDSFDGTGDRDGYANIAARLRAHQRLGTGVGLTVTGVFLDGRSQFDGFDPMTFQRADTGDESRNRLAAGRAALDLGTPDDRFSGTLGATLLSSRNRNRLDDAPVNETRASRRLVDVLGRWTGRALGGEQALNLALSASRERFRASDTAYGGATDQRRTRHDQAATLEWRGHWSGVAAEAAVRHDRFDRFRDATTARAGVLLTVTHALTLVANAGTGIAQPTFFDLYGFFPGSFAGNPALRPEKSHGGEAGVRWTDGAVSASLTHYVQRLSDEIVDVFDPVTFLSSTDNAAGRSHRRGNELTLQYAPSPRLALSAQAATLHADEPDAAGGAPVRELRRPRFSGGVTADGTIGRWTYGAGVTRTGAHDDRDFDTYPAPRVRLAGYWLANARLAYAVNDALSLFVRSQNAFDARYQDVVGYRTAGRSIHAGLRLGR